MLRRVPMSENIRPELQKLIDRGNVTLDEIKELRCNSWEWDALVPAMSDDALLDRMQYAIDNCARGRVKPSLVYEDWVIGVFAPELMKRLATTKRQLEVSDQDATGYAEAIVLVAEALGQKSTHYLIIADDVKDLVEAVEFDRVKMNEYTRRRQLGEIVFPPEELRSYEVLQRLRDNRVSVRSISIEELTRERAAFDLERTPDGHINNCSLANSESEKDCQICGGACPDRKRFE